MTVNRLVNERERGQIPLSIATSLAFESLLNIHEEIKHEKPIYLENKCIYINVKTLYRNLYYSMKREDVDRTSDKDLYLALVSEIELIKDICRNECQGLDYLFYLPNYQGLESINNEVLLRTDNTSLQKTFTNRMTNSLSLLLKQYNEGITDSKQLSNENIHIFKNKITKMDNRKVLMLSHYTYDLVAFRNFNRLLLLESHTGHVKGRDMWYTKYYNGNKLPEMPFRLDLLTILGDSTLFRCNVPAFRRTLVDLATEYNWSSITTATKIRENLKTIKNHEIRERLLACISGM